MAEKVSISEHFKRLLDFKGREDRLVLFLVKKSKSEPEPSDEPA